MAIMGPASPRALRDAPNSPDRSSATDVTQLAERRRATGRYVDTAAANRSLRLPATPASEIAAQRLLPAERSARAGGASARSDSAGAAGDGPLGNTGLNSPTAGQGIADRARVALADTAIPAPDPCLRWTVQPADDPTDADLRWAVHTGVGWRLSPLRKVRSCRRAPFDADSDEVGMTFRPREDGGIDVGVGGMKTCGSWHSCIPCGTRIAVHRARELEHVFKVWEAPGNSVVLATFTVRHNRGHRLHDLIAGQRDGWAAVTSDRPWKADLADMGVALFPTEDRNGRVRNIKGVIRAFETTHGDEHGWHPHFHVFFLVEGSISQESAAAAVAPMWDRWCAGLAEHGLTAVAQVDGESAGLDVTVLGAGGSATWGKYPFKLALEAVGGIFKNGRGSDRHGKELGHRHRTPTEVMEHLAVAQADGTLDDDQGVADQAIYREWCTTANDLRIRQCPIPMRAWFAVKAAELGIDGPLLDDDQDDEVVAAQGVEGTEIAGHIPARHWTSTVAYELDTLRDAGRRLGLGGVVSWYDQRGIPFELSRPGEARLAEEQDRPPPGVVVAVWSGGRRMAVAG